MPLLSEEQKSRELYWALRTRVLTDEEMNIVRSEGSSAFALLRQHVKEPGVVRV